MARDRSLLRVPVGRLPPTCRPGDRYRDHAGVTWQVERVEATPDRDVVHVVTSGRGLRRTIGALDLAGWERA